MTNQLIPKKYTTLKENKITWSHTTPLTHTLTLIHAQPVSVVWPFIHPLGPHKHSLIHTQSRLGNCRWSRPLRDKDRGPSSNLQKTVTIASEVGSEAESSGRSSYSLCSRATGQSQAKQPPHNEGRRSNSVPALILLSRVEPQVPNSERPPSEEKDEEALCSLEHLWCAGDVFRIRYEKRTD